jgi:hypothetical protein
VELYLHSPNTPSWSGAQTKHRDNFTFITCNYMKTSSVESGFVTCPARLVPSVFSSETIPLVARKSLSVFFSTVFNLYPHPTN